MNQDNEVGKDQVSTSPKERLEQAIQDYLDSLDSDGREGAEGAMLTGWLLVTEEQVITSGKSCMHRAVKDHQAFSTTLGLTSYADKFYSAMVAGTP